VVYAINENGIDNLWVQPLAGSPGHSLTHFSSELITGNIMLADYGQVFAVGRPVEIDVVLLSEGKQ
jgi:hypothetical protein